MTLDTLIMLAGAFVAILPFLGFPNSWDTVLFFLAGVFIISLGVVLRRRSQRPPSENLPKDSGTFIESKPQQER